MAIILFFDLTNRESFESLPTFLEEAKKYGSKDAVPFLVGGKLDLVDERVVTNEEGAKFASDHGMQYFEVSSKDNVNVKETFHSIVSGFLSKI